MPAGRPKKEIDRKQFEKLCGMKCTLIEIAGFFECSEDTIERWCKREYKEKFADIYKKKSAIGNISLRRNQLKLSEKSAAMAIFLGKNWLGQRDSLPEDDEHMISALENVLVQIRKNTSHEKEETNTNESNRAD